MRTVARVLQLVLFVFVSCGFTWGFGSEDHCAESKNAVHELSRMKTDDLRAAQEKRIIALCPEGGPAFFVRGLQMERNGDSAGALTAYRKAISLDDSLPEAHGNLGLLLLGSGRTDEAAIELTKGLMGQADPRYHLGLATVLAQGNMHALALFHYGEARKGLPTDVSCLAGMGDAYGHLGEGEKAVEAYRNALAIKPDDMEIRLKLAQAELSRGKLGEALGELKAVAAAKPRDRKVHQLLAEMYQKQGDAEAAQKEWELAGVTIAPQPLEFVREGDRELAARKFEKAAVAYRKALKIRQEWPEVLKKLGDVEAAAGNDDAAISAFREAVRLDSSDSDGKFSLGSLYERNGRLEDAIGLFVEALRADPDNGMIRRRLADIYALRGNFPQAIEQYTALLKDRSDNPILHLKLAKVLVKSRKIKEALAEYEQAQRLDPDNLEGHRELAVLYARQRMLDKAVDQYREVLRLKQDEMDARLALISLYVKMKDYQGLTELLEEGTRLFPDDANSHYRLGIIYEFRKNLPAAIEEYRKTVELQPLHAKGHNALGRLYLKTGRTAEARVSLEAAKKADPGLAEPRMLLNTIREDLSAEKSHYKKKYTKKYQKKHTKKSVKSRRKKIKKKRK